MPLSHADSSLFLTALRSRRSAKAVSLKAPAPTPAQLETVLLAAASAPDHGRLVPYRFVEIGENRRMDLADLLAQAALSDKPDLPPEEIERVREKALHGPVLVAMIAKIDPEIAKIPISDQWLAAGCALQNLLLAAHALGFSAAIRSGKFLHPASLRVAFKLAAPEHLVALIALGTASEFPPAKPKPTLGQIFTPW